MPALKIKIFLGKKWLELDEGHLEDQVFLHIAEWLDDDSVDMVTHRLFNKEQDEGIEI